MNQRPPSPVVLSLAGLLLFLAGCSPFRRIDGIPDEGVRWRDADGRVGAVLYPKGFVVPRSLAIDGVLPEVGSWEDPREAYLAYPDDGPTGWTIWFRSTNVFLTLEPIGPETIAIEGWKQGRLELTRDPLPGASTEADRESTDGP